MLPNAEKAVIEIEKLRDYCLNPEHPRGKHKARVFLSVLDLGPGDAAELRQIILDQVLIQTAEKAEQDQYGQRFSVDIPIERGQKVAAVRTAWIIKAGESAPRLTSCYVKV